MDNANSTRTAILHCLEDAACGVSMSSLVALLPGHDKVDVKNATNDLYMQGRVNRLQVQGATRKHYVFFSLYVRTQHSFMAPGALTADEALDVLKRAGWVAADEVTA